MIGDFIGLAFLVGFVWWGRRSLIAKSGMDRKQFLEFEKAANRAQRRVTISLLPLRAVPVAFFGRQIEAIRHRDEENVVARCATGFALAFGVQFFIGFIGYILMKTEVVLAHPSLGEPAHHPYPLWLTTSIMVFAGVNMLSTLPTGILFARYMWKYGPLPGQDPTSPEVQAAIDDRRLRRAIAVEALETGQSKRKIRAGLRSGEYTWDVVPEESEGYDEY